MEPEATPSRAAPDPPTSEPTPGQLTAPELGPVARLVYRSLRRLILIVGRPWLRLEVRGAEHIPATGGFILAPGGHRSNLDTPILSVVTRRVLRFMGKEGLWRVPVLPWVLTALGGFPVQRGLVDREALRRGEEVLARGEPLVVFPEGTRKRGPLVEDVKDGAAFLACRAGVPIVPVGMAGTERAMGVGARFIRPAKVVIVVGEPIHPPARQPGGRVKRSDVRQLTATLQGRLQALFDTARTATGG